MKALTNSVIMSFMVSSAVVSHAQNPKAARSVHMRWPAPPAQSFYNEVTVEQVTPGSYFMACGFRDGYFGIQELNEGPHIILFSIWDSPTINDPHGVPEDQRTEVLYVGDGVKVQRFGGEGAGAKSFAPFDWKVGETYRFLVRAESSPGKMTYAGYVYLNDSKTWKHLATFRVHSQQQALVRLYSFVEDFRRDGKSVTEVRRARFGNGWVQTLAGKWVSLDKSVFTADNNTHLNINGGAVDDRFFMATGGDTTNTTPLMAEIDRLMPAGEPPVIPTGDLAE